MTPNAVMELLVIANPILFALAGVKSSEPFE